jgi:hypothetical protein
VSLFVQFNKDKTGRGTWQFNDNLLSNLEYVYLEKNKCIDGIFTQYSSTSFTKDEPVITIDDQLL